MYFRDISLVSLSLPNGSSFNIELIDETITATELSNIAILAGISHSDKTTLQQSISKIIIYYTCTCTCIHVHTCTCTVVPVLINGYLC